jgi:RNA polymerase sigma factor (sigma-70 family)
MASAASGTVFHYLSGLFAVGTVTGLGDEQLLARYSCSKDEVAFEALVARHGPMVLATCRAVLKREHDVEDAFQTTFLVLARKAHSIRGGTLGGWLHRVAYRVAVRASVEAKRRRRKEVETSTMAPLHTSRPAPATGDDLRPILHEAIERLPESQRLPVVLCDLEGLTYIEAATQLRWTVPTLRYRLAKGRRRLKDRLTRQGFAVPASGSGLSTAGTPVTVPAALIRSTVLAATGGAVSAGAAHLTRAILRRMLMTKIKFAATAALTAIAIASIGVLVAGGQLPEAPRPPGKKAEAAGVPRARPTAAKPLEAVEIRGRVLAPDGRPVAAAAVRAMYASSDGLRPSPEELSGGDGRFSIRLTRPEGAPEAGNLAFCEWLVASAPGYGVGWLRRVLVTDRPAEQVVTLADEGPPIEGRTIDLEGRPVKGASVRVARIWYDEKGDLADWIAKARNGAVGGLEPGLKSLSLEPIPTRAGRARGDRPITIAATTADDGRFTLTGIGRDRVAELIVSGPGIATTQVHVFSRPEPEVRADDRGTMRRHPFIVRAPGSQLVLAPTQWVQGVIRDKDSGKPIAGLEIQAAVFEQDDRNPDPGIEATTDAEGRYRIEGLPKAGAYRLLIKTVKGLPYTNTSLRVPAESPGTEPVIFDIALKRGVVVRGKVTDKVTGRPIRGSASYYAFNDNPNVREYPGFSDGNVQYADVDDAGRYEIVALPGRGLIAVRDELRRYRPTTGYEDIAGYDAEHKVFRTVPWYLPADQFIVAEVVADRKAESILLDLQADPGKSVAIEVVGPDGAPIGGIKVKGLHELSQSEPLPQPSSRFEVYALDASRPRRVVVVQEGRKLIGTALLKGDEAGPVRIQLQPWGSVAGRIVDDESRPRKAMSIGSPDRSGNKHPETHDILPGSDRNPGVRVGDDSRFLVEGLVPGLKYRATARTGFEAVGDLFVDVTVAVGEAKDLGDLKVHPPQQGDAP